MLESALSGDKPLQPGSTREDGGYVIAGFVPGDAADIPPAFEEVYGADYVNPVVYDAEAFAGLVASGDHVSFVARDAKGDFAGHLALNFSAPNRSLVEVCQGIVLPAHRKSGIFARLMDRVVAFARDDLRAQGIFGTALTNHVVSQRVLAASGFRDYGLELDYAPQRLLRREGATGPAAILLQYLDFGHERRAACHLPPSYALWFSRLLNEGGVSGPRQVTMAADLDRQASIAEVKDLPRFDMSRVTVRRAGFDFWSLVADEEAKAEAAGRRSFQVLISLGDAEGAAAVEMLRGWGYACSGLSPNYLEDGQHAAIMYRCFAEPYFEGIQLHNAAALRLLDNVMADWRRAERLGAELRHAFDDQSAETPTPAPLPPLPDSPRQPMETTLQLLGLGGRVPLAEGGMVPVDLGGGDGPRDAASPAPAAPRPSLPAQDAAD
jgi:GNAT superfamily N-acetyltransferase